MTPYQRELATWAIVVALTIIVVLISNAYEIGGLRT